MLTRNIFAACAFFPTIAVAAPGFVVSDSQSKLSSPVTQVALLRSEKRTAMTVSAFYSGSPRHIALVIPVPASLAPDQVTTLYPYALKSLELHSAPHLFQYWEMDPCGSFSLPILPAVGESSIARELILPNPTKPPAQSYPQYNITILSSNEAKELEQWLQSHNYWAPSGTNTSIKPYLRDGMKILIATMDASKLWIDERGKVQLSPLRISFDSTDMTIPLGLGRYSVNVTHDLFVYILDRTRIEASDYPNVLPPTNIEITSQAGEHFDDFYAAFFGELLKRAGNHAVVTERVCEGGCMLPDVRGLQWDLIVRPLDLTPLDAGSAIVATANNYVLSRLHLRTSRTGSPPYLRFRAARPVLARHSDPERSVKSDNDFLVRFVIRNWWDGPVSCKVPCYQQWAGDPTGKSTWFELQVATDQQITRKPPLTMSIDSVVLSSVPKLGLRGQTHRLRPGEQRAPNGSPLPAECSLR